MTYPGGKAGDGVFHKIINQLPPHETYVEPFLGGGAILRLKLPAAASIAIDADGAVTARWERNPYQIPNLTVLSMNALDWMGTEGPRLKEWDLVYLDPPYLAETRRSGERIYRHELSDDDHRRLLEIVTGLRCKVAISGYWSRMYNDALASWRAITYQARTRSGTATEYLWMNYPQPVELHDYRYLGNDFRERERIKRKKTRWVERLKTMPPAERYAMLAAIEEVRWGGQPRQI